MNLYDTLCHSKHKRLTFKKSASFAFCIVEVTGLEPATAWSQTRNATNCATPRYEKRVQNYKEFLTRPNFSVLFI